MPSNWFQDFLLTFIPLFIVIDALGNIPFVISLSEGIVSPGMGEPDRMSRRSEAATRSQGMPGGEGSAGGTASPGVAREMGLPREAVMRPCERASHMACHMVMRLTPAAAARSGKGGRRVCRFARHDWTDAASSWRALSSAGRFVGSMAGIYQLYPTCLG